MTDFKNLTDVLVWLSQIGSPYVGGYIISLIAENFPVWHTFSARLKIILTVVTSVIVAVLAHFILQQPDIVNQLAPLYSVIAGAVIAYLGTQNAYISAKKSNYGSSAKAEARKIEG